ncbi:MAG TPA: 4-hydroxy-tetrahydrodipicolinate synthase [Candidatus Hydrogenedentes bacterium]|nr:4-hydroxy-tetrahydrodipicolinate synthase [Candidatus Hydrogenedentota bacterium]
MYSGSFVALVTPFKDNFDIDFDAYGRLIDMQLENGTHGIVPAGCTGEAATLTHDEQKKLISFAINRIAGKVPVVAGTGSNNTAETLDFTQYAKDAGADGALMITPYYNKPTREGIIAHYTTVADKIELPIMLYNVPGRTQLKMEPETIATLAKHPNIVSVKEACGSVDQVSQIRSQSDINVMSGDDPLTLPMMAVGASGVVSVAANVVPDKVAALTNAFHAGDLQKAQEIHYEILPLNKALFAETNPMPVKKILAEMGLIKNVLRLPLTPMLPQKYDAIKSIVAQYGLI